MIHNAPSDQPAAGHATSGQMAQLRHVLMLIEEMAGGNGRAGDVLQDSAHLASAYDAAPPILRRRFDTLAAETEAWAAAAVDALIGSERRAPGGLPKAAARCAAVELSRALKRLDALLN